MSTRRFFLSDHVQALYAFVDSLGEDIFLDSCEYDLMQVFPRNVFNDHKATLAQVGLQNKEMLQIREN